MSHPSLPPELWRRILREATSPPGGLITSWNYTPSEKLFRGWEGMNYVDPTIKTKRTIVLVCRQWRSIGIEFLYQWIRFDSPRRVEALLEVFRASVGKAGGRAAASYGWWVRRIDVAASMVENDELEEFIKFVGLCDRVELVLQIPPFGYIMGDHDLHLTYLLANRFKHSIHYIRFRTPRPFAAPPSMTLTALMSLSLAFSVYMDQIVPDWLFPALRFLKLSNIRDSVVPKLLPFLAIHGRQLTGLHIRTSKSLLPMNIASILSRMTTLQSIVLDQAMLITLSAMSGSFPSISHLGVQLVLYPSRRNDHYDTARLMSCFEGLLKSRSMPGLKVVRLLDLGDTESLGEMWSSLSDVCRAENVVLCGKE